MRKILIAIGCIIMLVVSAGGIGYYRFNKMKSYLTDYTFKKLPLSAIADGTYHGTCSAFLLQATVDVTVENHCITSVDVIKQQSSKGYLAEAITERIIRKQSLDVDAISGATGSSTCIRIACEKALVTGKKVGRQASH